MLVLSAPVLVILIDLSIIRRALLGDTIAGASPGSDRGGIAWHRVASREERLSPTARRTDPCADLPLGDIDGDQRAEMA